MNLKKQIKQTGATFTPLDLADYLAEKLLNLIDLKGQIKVLDPACGEGELLLAMGNTLTKSNLNFSLTGFDSNDQYLSIAKKRSSIFGPNVSNYVIGDFLEAIELTKNQLSLHFASPEKPNSVNNFADIVIANPPYVRTQVLGAEKSQVLAKKFNLKGRVDLYYPFLI